MNRLFFNVIPLAKLGAGLHKHGTDHVCATRILISGNQGFLRDDGVWSLGRFLISLICLNNIEQYRIVIHTVIIHYTIRNYSKGNSVIKYY